MACSNFCQCQAAALPRATWAACRYLHKVHTYIHKAGTYIHLYHISNEARGSRARIDWRIASSSWGITRHGPIPLPQSQLWTTAHPILSFVSGGGRIFRPYFPIGSLDGSCAASHPSLISAKQPAPCFPATYPLGLRSGWMRIGRSLTVSRCNHSHWNQSRYCSYPVGHR